MLFLAAMLWAAAARFLSVRSAAGLALRFRLGLERSLLQSLFLLFLVVVGFQALDWIANRGALPNAGAASRDVLPLPVRSSSRREWLTGAAIGWGLCLAVVVPILLASRYHATLNRGVGVPGGILIGTLTLLAGTLAQEAIFRGYPFQRLVQGIGPAWASVVLSSIFAIVLVAGNPPVHLGLPLLNEMLFGLLLAMAYLRTHALWLGWGLHFAFRAVMADVLGLAIAGQSDFGSLMDGYTRGPRWLSGGAFGPDAALLTGLCLLITCAVLYRVSRDWAWAYTLPEIVPGGYEVVVAPPAAHVAMEKASAPPPLVQILPVATPPPIPARRDPEREL